LTCANAAERSHEAAGEKTKLLTVPQALPTHLALDAVGDKFTAIENLIGSVRADALTGETALTHLAVEHATTP
jgi:hypothetical protein